MLLLLGVLMLSPAYGKYDDTIYFVNGDRLKGDIKELSRDMLRLKTDAMGTVYIRWDQVQSLDTKQLLRIELRSGRRFVGSIGGSDVPARLSVATRGTEELLDRDSVVAFVPLKLQQGWIDRVDGSVRFGLSGTKGSNTVQWNFGANALYRGEHFEFSTRVDTIVTDKSDDTSSERAIFINNYRRLLANRWFWNLLAGWERNDELGIEQRWSVGGGVGRFLYRSNSIELLLQGGVLANREFRTNAIENQIESYLGASVLWFRHSFPKTDIKTEVLILPSLTESGRVRSNLDVSLKREFVEDLFLNLSLYYSTDNKTPEEANGDDWGLVTSVEYKF